MKPLKLLATMLCLLILTVIPGCSLLGEQPVYMPEGSVAEVAEPVKVEAWITNKVTGAKEKRILDISPGYYVARPATRPLGRVEAEPVPLVKRVPSATPPAVGAENSCPIAK